MFPFSDFKIIATTLSLVLGVLSYIPYIRSMVLRQTTPHPYTWLIWSITTGTAAVGGWYGGGGYGVLLLALWSVLTFLVFLLSFKYGTKNITKGDVTLLVLALLAILVWWQLNAPLLSILMVTAIDAFGYVPTIRKVLEEPWSESLASWFLFTVTALIGLVALAQYNFLTVVYLAMSATLNTIVISICLFRRQKIKKPTIAVT
ncbi:MAG: hypothetical protein Greene07147_893 [Parcubacteria group bacterium Greene0714_7]|nr:MAG: hypothetical protein Greene07147_893 [Parcubacteria group bacterium Greene0714_7]